MQPISVTLYGFDSLSYHRWGMFANDIRRIILQHIKAGDRFGRYIVVRYMQEEPKSLSANECVLDSDSIQSSREIHFTHVVPEFTSVTARDLDGFQASLGERLVDLVEELYKNEKRNSTSMISCYCAGVPVAYREQPNTSQAVA